MSSNNLSSSASAVTGQSSAGDDSALEVEKLRSILFQPERDEINQLQEQLESLQFRLDDAKTRAAETSEVLTAATQLTHSQNEKYSSVLKPIVVEQFQTSSRENPEIMAEALFPILGPAIRKMIANMLSLDKNKKKRTYKFEQLFLIEKESGLPICHAKSEAVETQDADMVSGMLSAIQSFVQDAFSTEEFDSLNTLQLGELSVWVEWGPSAVVAAVIRGVAPEHCRTALQQLLEDIHRDYADQLNAYEGDALPFKVIESDFLLFMDNHDSRLRNRVRNLPKKTRNAIFVSALAGIALIIWLAYNQYDKARWNNFVDMLDAEPGIVVTNAERSGGQYIVKGLRDPMAALPAVLLGKTNLNADNVIFELESYTALHAEFTVRRLTSVLIPPAGVSLELVGSELVITGAKSKSWKDDATRLARQFTEVSYVTFLP